MRTTFFVVVAVMLGLLLASCRQSDAPSKDEASFGQIGYPTAAAALEGLRARRDVKFTTQQGWTVVTENGGLTIWTFAPPGHPAHPAVAKRYLTQNDDDSWDMTTLILCGATKTACDKLRDEYAELDVRMRQELEDDVRRK